MISTKSRAHTSLANIHIDIRESTLTQHIQRCLFANSRRRRSSFARENRWWRGGGNNFERIAALIFGAPIWILMDRGRAELLLILKEGKDYLEMRWRPITSRHVSIVSFPFFFNIRQWAILFCFIFPISLFPIKICFLYKRGTNMLTFFFLLLST